MRQYVYFYVIWNAPEVAKEVSIFKNIFERLLTLVIEQRVALDQSAERSHWTSFSEVNGSSFREVNGSCYLFHITNVVVIVIDLVESTIDAIHVKIIKFH